MNCRWFCWYLWINWMFSVTLRRTKKLRSAAYHQLHVLWSQVFVLKSACSGFFQTSPWEEYSVSSTATHTQSITPLCLPMFLLSLIPFIAAAGSLLQSSASSSCFLLFGGSDNCLTQKPRVDSLLTRKCFGNLLNWTGTGTNNLFGPN